MGKNVFYREAKERTIGEGELPPYKDPEDKLKAFQLIRLIAFPPPFLFAIVFLIQYPEYLVPPYIIMILLALIIPPTFAIILFNSTIAGIRDGLKELKE